MAMGINKEKEVSNRRDKAEGEKKIRELSEIGNVKCREIQKYIFCFRNSKSIQWVGFVLTCFTTTFLREKPCYIASVVSILL